MIHDPDVAGTDVVLALLAGYLGCRLWVDSAGRGLQRAGAVLLGALASAAAWGAIFHAFFPAGTTTLSGSLAWKPVALSIVVAAATMLDLGLGLLLPRLPRLRVSFVLTFAASFAAVIILLDDSFASIVRFYVPTLLLLLLAAARQSVHSRSAGWALILAGLLLSAGAAMLQQARVALHPVYFDHNAVYHVVQAVAVVFLYLGWRRAPDPARASRSV